MSLGNTLRRIRMQAGLTQRELAKRLNISSNYLCLLERGKKKPTIRLLESMASELSVSVSQLVWESTEIPSTLLPHERRLYERLRKASIELFEIANELHHITNGANQAPESDQICK